VPTGAGVDAAAGESLWEIVLPLMLGLVGDIGVDLEHPEAPEAKTTAVMNPTIVLRQTLRRIVILLGLPQGNRHAEADAWL
jgi:hypothetical protein